MLDQLLSGDRSGIVSNLVNVLGTDEKQAGGFLSKALELIQGALSSGKLDLNSLLSGNVSEIVSKLDLGSLSGLVGGSNDKATEGLGAIIGPLTSRLKEKGGGLEDLVSPVIRKQGGLKGLAGKLFGR